MFFSELGHYRVLHKLTASLAQLASDGKLEIGDVALALTPGPTAQPMVPFSFISIQDLFPNVNGDPGQEGVQE